MSFIATTMNATTSRYTLSDCDGFQNAQLTITGLTYSDAGDYNCTATNKFGTDSKQSNWSLKIKSKTKF